MLISVLHREDEKELASLETESRIANSKLQKADLDLSHLKSQLKQKKTELKGAFLLSFYSIVEGLDPSHIDMENKIKDSLEHVADERNPNPTLEEAIRIAAGEIESLTA